MNTLQVVGSGFRLSRSPGPLFYFWSIRPTNPAPTIPKAMKSP
jgi:hypothetical protein